MRRRATKLGSLGRASTVVPSTLRCGIWTAAPCCNRSACSDSPQYDTPSR